MLKYLSTSFWEADINGVKDPDQIKARHGSQVYASVTKATLRSLKGIQYKLKMLFLVAPTCTRIERMDVKANVIPLCLRG